VASSHVTFSSERAEARHRERSDRVDRERSDRQSLGWLSTWPKLTKLCGMAEDADC
jgi:hypothetical protein